MRQRVCRLFLGCVLLGLTGCAPLVFFGAGGAAGIAGYTYFRGAMTVTYQAPYIETWDATLRSLRAMELAVLEQRHDELEGVIEARGVEGKTITVSIAYRGNHETEVTIRVGLFGDESVAARIKEEIRRSLFEK